MNDISLAFKYLTRKKGSALFIFLVFVIVNTLIFSLISIRDGAETALSDLTPEVQNYFYLDAAAAFDPDSAVADGSSISFTTSIHPIDQKLIDRICQINDINRYAGSYSDLTADITSADNTPLKLVSYNNPATEDDFSLIRGVTDSEAFCGSEMKLTEGSHITASSSYNALVSTEYAQLNNLKTGDSIILNSSADAPEKNVKVTISGLYETFDESDNPDLYPFELFANMLYVDYDTAADLDTDSQGTATVKFFVRSPALLKLVLKQVKNLDINWQQYYLVEDADTPLTDSNSIRNVSALFALLTWITALIALLVVTFVLILQLRMRSTEMGIQLSLGITKMQIMRQHCLETMIPALSAIAMSYLITKVLLQYRLFAAAAYTPQLSPKALPQLLLINMFLIAAATFLSSAKLLRTKPRDIFNELD